MKIYRACGLNKPRKDFYAHPRMADGALNFCKTCVRKRIKLHRLMNPHVQENDRQRSKTPKRRAHLRANAERWDQHNPAAYRAHNIANAAVRDRKLSRQPCQICGAIEHVHKHHRNYSRPLDIVWLCAKCHARVHALFPEMGGH